MTVFSVATTMMTMITTRTGAASTADAATLIVMPAWSGSVAIQTSGGVAMSAVAGGAWSEV